MHDPKLTWLVVSVVCGFASVVGCTYEPPEVGTPTTTGTGGNGNTSSSNGAGGSAGQGGAGGQQMGTGGSAGTGMCTFGETSTCEYTGPATSLSIPPCKAGVRTCSGEGAWLPCSDEVLPTPEGCLDKTKELNCDGADPCTGGPIGIRNPTTQTADSDGVLALATGPGRNGRDGFVYAVGGKGITNTDSVNNSRVLFAAVDPDGATVDWSSKFTFDPDMQFIWRGAIAYAVAVLRTEEVVVVGRYFGGKLMIGDIMNKVDLGNAGFGNSFVAIFSPQGAFVRAFAMGGSGTSVDFRAVTTDSMGNIIVGGTYSGSPAFGGTTLPAPALGSRHALIASMKPDSALYNWVKSYDGGVTGLTNDRIVVGLTLLEHGNIAAVTAFDGDMNVKTTGNATESFAANSDTDLLLNEINPATGEAVWNKQIIGNQGRIDFGGLAASASSISIGGRFAGSAMLGQGGPTFTVNTSTTDSFVAHFAPMSGNVMTSYWFQGAGNQEVRGLAYDSFGHLVLVGSYSDNFSVSGTGSLTMSTGVDAFVVKTDASLAGQWGHKFGADTAQIAQAAVVGKTTGHVFVGGSFDGQFTVGGQSAMTTGGVDAFLIELGD